MASPAIPVFLAGPFPVLKSSHVDQGEQEVDLDVALLINGQPNILASTTFPLDDTWDRIVGALTSGDAKLGVAGMPHEGHPSAYVGLECANGERLVLAHIKGMDMQQDAEAYAREVIAALLTGATPNELGEAIEEDELGDIIGDD